MNSSHLKIDGWMTICLLGPGLFSGNVYHPCLEDSGCCYIFWRGNDVLYIQNIFYCIIYSHMVKP